MILATTILLGCSHDKPTMNDFESNDTTVKFRTLGEEEQYLWTYFQRFEKQLENDPEIKKEDITKLIQILIDEGDIETPVIYFETEDGTESRIVDYLAYKEFRKKEPN